MFIYSMFLATCVNFMQYSRSISSGVIFEIIFRIHVSQYQNTCRSDNFALISFTRQDWNRILRYWTRWCVLWILKGYDSVTEAFFFIFWILSSANILKRPMTNSRIQKERIRCKLLMIDWFITNSLSSMVSTKIVKMSKNAVETC